MHKRRAHWLAAAILLGLTTQGLTSVQAAQAPQVDARALNNLFVAASSQANPSVVTIASERVVRRNTRYPFFDFWGREFGPDRESRGTVLGSGVIIDAGQGYIITNNHVVDNADGITVTLFDKRQVVAEVVGADRASDVAVIKIAADDLQAAEMGDSDDLRIGEWVLAIGSPFSANLEHTVTAGIVSAKGRSDVLSFSRDRYEDFIQTDAAINPGNSGGALINLDGQLVGINTAIATDGFSRANAGVGFAIPINLVKRVADDLIAQGHVTRAWLGVGIESLTESVAQALKVDHRNGALVSQVMEDSPAEKAAVKEGDIILKVDEVEIRDASHLKNVISSSRPGDRRKLTLVRKRKERTIQVRLGELPGQETYASRGGDSKGVDGMVDDTGFTVADLNSQDAQRYNVQVREGVVVTRVHPHSRAARNDIRPGDVVVRVGDKHIRNAREYRQALKAYGEGDTLLLRIARGEVFIFRGLELG
ncbi:MAG: Do family serine endopeptidase [Candidatus Neomarinimicrobiota bacterium]